MANNDTPLTKNQLGWLICRLLGAYLLVYGIMELFSLFSVFQSFTSSGVRKSLQRHMNAVVVIFIFRILLFGAGYYLLVDGAIFHRLLMREGGSYSSNTSKSSRGIPRSTEVVDPDTQLTATETEQFKNWLNENPEKQRFDPIDQLALFRDYLKEK